MTSTIIIHETPEIEKLVKLHNEADLTIQERSCVSNIIKKIKKVGFNLVEYKYSKRICAKGDSIQYLSNNSRSFLCADDYVDLDMKSCALNILKSLVHKYEMEQFYSVVDKLFEIKDKIEDKVKLNSFLFGNSVLEGLSKEEIYIFKKLREEIVVRNKPLYKIKNSEYNFDGTALSHIIYYFEYLCIQSAIEYFNINEIEYSTIVFDGIYVKEITKDQIEELEDHIQENTEIITKWVIKPWMEIPEKFFRDTDINSTSSTSENEKDDIINVVFCEFVNWANENKYVRLEKGTFILEIQEQKYNAKLVYEEPYEIINSFTQYCYDKKYNYYGSIDKNTEKIDKALTSFLRHQKPHNMFPVIKKDLRYMGYKNGVFDLNENRFITGEDIPDNMLCRKYFDEIYNPLTEVPTEIMTIFNHQEFTKETQDNILYMLGRAYFAINQFDTLGKVLCCYGASSVGKSTLIDAIAGTMDRVTVIGSVRKEFSLDNKYDVELLKIGEAENLMKGIQEEDFKEIIRGGVIDIDGKCKDRKDRIWKTPILLASQNPVKVEDKSGAINKQRILNVKFSKLVKTQDITFSERVKKLFPQFIPYLINHYYNYKFETAEQILDWNNDICSQSNPFEEWVKSMNENCFTQFVIKKGHSIKPEDLRASWSKHWKYTLQNTTQPPAITVHDQSILTDMGAEKKDIKFCLYCEKPHKCGCCDKYCRTKRKTLTVWANCDLITGGLDKRFDGRRGIEENEDREDTNNFD